MSTFKTPIRFLHSSDWQLGMTRHFLSTEAGHRFSQDRIDAIKQLGELATEHEAVFIVVAGDVFESNQLSRQTVLRTLEALKQLPVPVFLLPGNHDPLDVSSIFSTQEFIDAGDHVVVIRDTKPIPVPGLAGVEVVGAPWRTKHPSTDLCADMLAELDPADGVVRVAVCHGQPDTLSPDKSRPEIINLANAEAAINDGVIHYLALGDRHSLTDVSNSTGRVWFSGAPVATDFTEDNPNKALLVELDDDNCNVTELKVGDWQFVVDQFDLNNEGDLEQFTQWLADLPNKERTIVKVGFTGTINLAIAARKDELFERQADVFASLRQRERTTDLSVVPDELDQDSVSLAGYAKEAWDDLLKDAAHDIEAQGALRLFYRLSQGGVQE
jgi:DNA repair exonuclease SbcCD nuclease subunit